MICLEIIPPGGFFACHHPLAMEKFYNILIAAPLYVIFIYFW